MKQFFSFAIKGEASNKMIFLGALIAFLLLTGVVTFSQLRPLFFPDPEPPASRLIGEEVTE